MQGLNSNLRPLEIKVESCTFDNTGIWSGFLGQPERNLESLEFRCQCWVLHFFKHDAFLHLSDVFFFYNTHEVLESSVNFVGVELVRFSDTFVQEVVSSLFGENTHLVCTD